MIHKGFVQTVLGPVKPESLGLTLPHEHVLIDMTKAEPSAEALINVTESAVQAVNDHHGCAVRGGKNLPP